LGGESGAGFDFPQTNEGFHYLIATTHHCLHQEICLDGGLPEPIGLFADGRKGKENIAN